MAPSNPRYILYHKGLSAIKNIPGGWPLSYDLVADALNIPGIVLKEARRGIKTLHGRRLEFEQACKAWDWLCYRSRNPVMLKLRGIEDKKIVLEATPNIELQEGLRRIGLIPYWPVSHRRLALYLNIAYTTPRFHAKKLGLDTSKGFTKEIAEQVWKLICQGREALRRHWPNEKHYPWE